MDTQKFLYWFNLKVLMIPPSVYIQSSLTMETAFDTMKYEVCQAQLHGQSNHKSRTKQNSMSNSLVYWLDINNNNITIKILQVGSGEGGCTQPYHYHWLDISSGI